MARRESTIRSLSGNFVLRRPTRAQLATRTPLVLTDRDADILTARAIQGDDTATRQRAARWYEQSEAEPGSVHPELVSAATSIVAAKGDEAVFERMVEGSRHGDER